MKFISFFMLLLLPLSISSNNGIPVGGPKVIEGSQNRAELDKVLDNYCEPKDSLKYEAACFLIENMAIHTSNSYYWIDDSDRVVDFNELDYEDFNASLKAFEKIKEQKGKLRPIPTVQYDISTMTADYLIKNIDMAFENWSKDVYDFNTFCEYILPYRISVEPAQDWRKEYYDKFSKIIIGQDKTPLNIKLKYLIDNINLWFVCTYGIEERTEPLPRLGALQLLHRKKGYCEDVAALSALALRSIGIPATVDMVPYWATSTGSHVLNCSFDSNNEPVHFDALLLSDSLHEFIREPAKVLRTTYSVQTNTLASKVNIEQIPEGILRAQNYIDVTHEYWATKDVECTIKPSENGKIVYACVFNGGEWKPVWWGESKNDKVKFSNLCQGAVFLPKYYENGKMVTAGYPVASGHKQTWELKPLEETHTITIKEFPRYLKFRPGKKYRLVYYDFGWKTISIKTASEDTKELVFENVPQNALLLLVPNYGTKKERPFIITDEGKRLWW